jgi:hypothetical protein
VGVSLKRETLILTAYLKPEGEDLFIIRSRWKLTGSAGAVVESRNGDLYTMVLQVPPGAVRSQKGSYVKVSAELRFANR